MRKYLWPILVIALALLVAGAWVLFPEERTTASSAVSSFCTSFADHARNAWTRLFPPTGEAEVPEADLLDEGDIPDAPSANAASTVATSLGAIADPASDPEPGKLTPEQRKRRYKELVAAADTRKREVMRSNLMKSEVGKEALKATRAYHAKVDAMKKLEEKFGPIDDRVEMIRIELVALKESVKVANARYKAWKDAHPTEVVDPLADKLYKDLLYRSRFFRD